MSHSSSSGLTALLVATSLLAPPALAASGPQPLPAGAKYVAMGSSYASGPGVTSSADTPPNRCTRSADNYAHLLARKRGFSLTDASCSGATTSNLLGPWGELPAQVDAVDADTRLVTITIGGNDLGYVGGLMAASCAELAAKVAASTGKEAPAAACPRIPPPSEQAYLDLEARMRNIAAEVRRRAPAARLVFVQYPAVLPPHGTCAAVPLSPAQADASRRIAMRLAEITDHVAKESGAEVLQTQLLTARHSACAEDPWMNGYAQPGAPVRGAIYHPNLEGMTAVAEALDRMLP
ncbi:MAG TPA: SGNH/GDSL hydrolase family protein [Phenylobacterium sp.]|uniref:SGNH/GDSL hydrolase family protein n=1 Tax=Phenylobacterium sp. TaxID=1871053 RepID=UPI002B47D69B|nr:SGNH/GDSL hydrolase family protein [Phenylobacterium sp.]HKR87692.1 SGNH/GDSL hydrolase family protein [Phenylobacterium sp.]